MYARVITVQWKVDQVEEAITFFRENVVPALRQQPGFANARLLVDHNTGKGMMMSVWQSEADLQASSNSGFLKTQVGHLSRFFATAPLIDHYEICVNG
ncbi:MAG: antibiotic biosynthesis monooxygenase family protein [Caldilineaceae bacterium]|jgi:quinol monooxygenase YgiN